MVGFFPKQVEKPEKTHLSTRFFEKQTCKCLRYHIKLSKMMVQMSAFFPIVLLVKGVQMSALAFKSFENDVPNVCFTLFPPSEKSSESPNFLQIYKKNLEKL